MTANHPTLAELPGMSTAEVSALPLDVLQMLVEDGAALTARAKSVNEKIDAALDLRFAEKARSARSAEGKDTGRVRFDDDGFNVAADSPKSVAWDQKQLAKIAETIKNDWAEDVSDYLVVKYSVAENKYSAWPPLLRKTFDPARTVKAGKPSYEIIARKQEAA
jgi:hypothetical protein